MSAPEEKETQAGQRYYTKLVVLFAVVAIALVVMLVGQCSAEANRAASGELADELAGVQARVSFVGVGDNVPGDVIAELADAKAGSTGDGTYDYSYIFEHIAPTVQAADLAYINQETHIGGAEIGPRGYPSFNTTDEMADAVVDAGFDLVASATNHSYDWGTYGAIEHSRQVWNGKPVAFTGTATSWDEAREIPVVERNGITFALLNYTYGLNGFTADQVEGYYVNFIDKERITVDVHQAREKADVVLVAMHWGTEYEEQPNAQELEYAQLLADLGVDVVLGSHPHVIQPMTWLEGEGGNRTLVCYSLGNFAIQHAHPTPENYLEGMLSCDFVRYEEGVRVENVKWVPMIYHGEQGNMGVYLLSDYTTELAMKNPAYEKLDAPLDWMREESARVVNLLGDEFEIAG